MKTGADPGLQEGDTRLEEVTNGETIPSIGREGWSLFFGDREGDQG